jgi:hypothetical protein
MRTSGTISAAIALLATGAGSALANCGPPAQVGTFTGDPEKDTFGLFCVSDPVSRTGSFKVERSRKIVQVGIRTGEPERDTFGYALTKSAEYELVNRE